MRLLIYLLYHEINDIRMVGFLMCYRYRLEDEAICILEGFLLYRNRICACNRDGKFESNV
jgi:hypothetical protein